MKKLNKIILIDMDGVIADFEKGFLYAWREKFPEKIYIPLANRHTPKIIDNYPIELHSEIESIYQSPGFILNLEPIQGAIESLNKMAELGCKIYLCSSPLTSYQNNVLEKYQWVEKHLSKEWIKKIILVKDKTLIKADYLIDDWPNRTGLIKPDWELIIFDQPYNGQISNQKRLNWSNWQSIIY